MKKIFLILIFSVLLLFPTLGIPEEGYNVSITLIEFDPSEVIAGVPFKIIFRLENTGAEAITPYAEVTVFGNVLDEEGLDVLRVIEKKYNVYNFYPGDKSGRHRMEVGVIPEPGLYKLAFTASVYDRLKKISLSQNSFTWMLDVK